MSAFFFSFIPIEHNSDPALPIAIPKNVAEGEKYADAFLVLGWASLHHGRLMVWERIWALQPDLMARCFSS